jgi:hypothetical protein
MICAIEWTRYCKASVEYIWRDRIAVSRGNSIDKETEERASKIVAYLTERGEAVFRTELLTDCFHRHVKAVELDRALEYLQLQTPPVIAVATVPRKGNPYVKAQKIQLFEKHDCEPCEPCEGSATAGPGMVREPCEPCEPPPDPRKDGSHGSQTVRTNSDRINTSHSHGVTSRAGLGRAFRPIRVETQREIPAWPRGNTPLGQVGTVGV